MDDVEITLLRHVAGDYDSVLGQLCMRCGMVLSEGGPSGFPPGQGVLVSVDGSLRLIESLLRADRDRSDEADCASIIEGRTVDQALCWCGHPRDQHTFPDDGSCWCCSCVTFAEDE